MQMDLKLDKALRTCEITLYFHGTENLWNNIILNEKKFSLKKSINPIQDGLFRGCSRIGGPFCPLPKIRHTYPTMKKHGTVISYLRKIQKMYKSRDTFFEFCWHQHFSAEISIFCYIKKYTYRLDFDT